MDNYLIEDFYYCENNWFSKNQFRVFRLNEVVEEEHENGIVKHFVPMMDGLFLKKEEFTDANGVIYVDNVMKDMRLTTYREIEPYVNHIYRNTEGSIKLYDVTEEKRKFFIKMKKEFQKRLEFEYLFRELRKFPYNNFYSENERIALSMLRSYYKCRILKV